jgi:DNA-binding XRE family transcriptional regulator
MLGAVTTQAPADPATAAISFLASTRELARSGRAAELRRAAGVSLRDVARAVGVDDSTIWRWETGQSRPRADAALRYGQVLHELARRLEQP